MKTIWMNLVLLGFFVLIGSTAQAQFGVGVSVPGVRLYTGYGAYPGYPAYGYGYGYAPAAPYTGYGYPVYQPAVVPAPYVGGYYGGFGYGPRYNGVYGYHGGYGGHGYYHR